MQGKHNDEPSSHTVMYRLPGQRTYHTLGCKPREISDANELASHSGFVFAPFDTNGGKCPILLFEGRAEAHEPAEATATPTENEGTPTTVCTEKDETADKERYTKAFAALHGMVANKDLGKVVLSRKSEVKVRKIAPEDIFLRACALHPDAFVAMVRTPSNGTWLCATPELLVEVNGATGRTMALAGTKQAAGDCAVAWDGKNRDEQRVVAQYVRERIEETTAKVNETAPKTVRAGNVCHLRSTFTFTIENGVSIGQLASKLHPTPAVCGFPQDRALKAIVANEGYDREYFSGYCGPVNTGGTSRLFVTLRCMKMTDGTATLYAGGGLMPGSVASDEWDETEAKMEAMRKLLRPETGQQ